MWMCNAACILAIGLDRHRLEGVAHMPGLQQLNQKNIPLAGPLPHLIPADF
jgi:hypothetical protein